MPQQSATAECSDFCSAFQRRL